MYKITLTKFNGPKKFVIAPATDIVTAAGHLKPIPGYSIELKDYKAFVTDKQDADCKAKFGIGIIEKLKESRIYKGNYLEIVQVDDITKKSEKDIQEAAEKKSSKEKDRKIATLEAKLAKIEESTQAAAAQAKEPKKLGRPPKVQ